MNTTTNTLPVGTVVVIESKRYGYTVGTIFATTSRNYEVRTGGFNVPARQDKVRVADAAEIAKARRTGVI